MLSVWLSGGRHSWANPDFDQLVKDAASFTGPTDERIKMFQDAEKILVEDVPGVFVYHETPVQFIKPWQATNTAEFTLEPSGGVSFAPSVLRERESDYLVNPKGLASPYMMLAFPTNPKRRDEIVAAVHPQDGTARAHIVDEAWNPGYHRVIREFERRTGIGAVLNTSFNLHGEPLVGSPSDAIETFERSGLPHLALGRFLVSKR